MKEPMKNSPNPIVFLITAALLNALMVDTSALASVLDPNAPIDVDYSAYRGGRGTYDFFSSAPAPFAGIISVASFDEASPSYQNSGITFGWFEVGQPDHDDSDDPTKYSEYDTGDDSSNGVAWYAGGAAMMDFNDASYTHTLHFDRIIGGGDSVQVTLDVTSPVLKHYISSGRSELKAKLKLKLAACDGEPISVTPIDPLAPLADVIQAFRDNGELDYMNCNFKMDSLSIGEDGGGILKLTQLDQSSFQVLDNGDINVRWAWQWGDTPKTTSTLYRRAEAVDPQADTLVAQKAEAVSRIFKNYGDQILLFSGRSDAEQKAAAAAFINLNKGEILSTLSDIDKALAQASIGARIGAMIQIQRAYGFVQVLEAKIAKGNALNEVISGATATPASN